VQARQAAPLRHEKLGRVGVNGVLRGGRGC
jgi:hypothetical protein